MTKLIKFLFEDYIIIPIFLMVLPLIIWIMPKLEKIKIEAEVKYGNCKILSNFTGDIYLCKKNK